MDLTPEQLKQVADYIRVHRATTGAGPMGMSDIGGMEDTAAAQRQMGGDIQQAAPPSAARNDWGSNLGRAGMGIASALRNYQSDKAMAGASLSRREATALELARLRAKNNVDPEELGGDNY